jgi:glycosyltransferase involved in cell wall biosynthesis
MCGGNFAKEKPKSIVIISCHQQRLLNFSVAEHLLAKKRNIKRRLKDFVKLLLRNNPKLISRLYASWAGLHGAPLLIDSLSLTQLAGLHQKHTLSLIGNKGINLLGFLKGEFGVAEASRAFARALQINEIPHVLNAVEVGGHKYGDQTFQDFAEDNPYNVNLISINPDCLPAMFKELGDEYFKNRYNIGIWYWELSEFPPQWYSCFALLDEIWVTSSFCATAIARVSPIPVVKITYPLVTKVPASQFNRAHFQIPEDVFAFVFSFDFCSAFERKNPSAVIEAFRRAFTKSDKALLVLKSINSQVDPAMFGRMCKQIKGLNVQVINQHLTHEEVQGLFAACDCLVSLHRSEGLGLGMAEAMAMGKPVIATAYSGNMEFMDINNSFPVRYKLVELTRDIGLYAKGNMWAEPDIDHAAELMRYVYENREAAARVGQRAAQDIKTSMNPLVTGREIQTRLQLLPSTSTEAGV